MQATVTEIGKHAIDDSEKMIILFGETATDTLKQQLFNHSQKKTKLPWQKEII